MSTQRTIFVVDDDPAARESVAALIKSRGMPVETFDSAEAFLAAFDPSRRGCLVLDVRMNGMSGLDLQERLAASGAMLPVIIITGHADVPMAVRAMQSGAVTFLEKPCADQELWANVQKALETDSRQEQQSARKAEVANRLATLTPAERQVLNLLMSGKPNKSIAAELDLGLRTVELRRSMIMKKMDAESLAELVRMVLSIRGETSEETSQIS
jgi:two-component system, LuxR family, response regulator FixJ